MSPPKNNPLPDVIGSALKAARQARKYERAELANLCCLSAKMILELEEGGMTSFYSYTLKINAAKRVGAALNLSESDYLSFPRASVVEVEGSEEGFLDSSGKNESNESAPSEKTSTPDSQSTNSVNNTVSPAITERLEWQELLTEKVGGDLAEANTRGRFRFPVKSVVFLSLGVVIAGIVFSLNSKYDIAYQVASLLEPEPKPQLILPAELPKAASDEAKTEAQTAPAEASQEIKPPEATAVAGQCPYKQDGQLPSYQSPNPSKLGDVVNIKTLIKQTLCVIDGSGKQLVIALEANTAHAFKGISPFTVLGQDLDNVEMFFQGWRVRLPNLGNKQVKLVEVNL